MIQPLETDTFMARERTTYDEVGLVLDDGDSHGFEGSLVGKLVYFDSWIAKKYPVKGTTDKFVWFVKYEDIVAYEPVSEQ